MPQGSLYIISAPSGAGKTSLVKALVEADMMYKDPCGMMHPETWGLDSSRMSFCCLT